jgi:hypothetical protein
MSKLETNTIDNISGSSTLTIGDSNASTISIPKNITLGASGTTITVPAGATITNNGTQTGFGGTNTPAWFVTKTATQSLSSNTVTTVVFETEEVDSDNAFSSNQFTVPSGGAGKYFAFGQVRFESATNFAYINAFIVKNSTDVVAAWNSNNNPDGYTTITVHCIVDLAETDTLKLQARQQSGSALNLSYTDRGHVVYFGGYKLIGV